MSTSSYDQIARVYATDMGQSMAFDDVAYYRQLCQQAAGPVLELGCGTGRILLELLAANIDIEGIDQSPGMLQVLREQAAERGLSATVRLGDLQTFSCARRFTTILAPYSVLTYLTEPEDLAAFWESAKISLTENGQLVTDSFIPRDVTSFDDFRLDYRRPHHGGQLQREKRIRKQGKCNHIERRYTLINADGSIESSWITKDVIRPYTESELIESARLHGFTCSRTDYDFSSAVTANPQFFILHFIPA